LPETLLEGVDREAVEEYWRRNDRPLEAAQRVWEERVYRPAWEAYHRAVERGMEKGDAYEGMIETAGPVAAGDLVEAIQEEYPGRWTEEELREALKGVTFPAVGEVTTLRKPPEERELSEAQEAFWEFYNEELPPGRLAAGARDYTLVQLVLDAETRGTATAEQYRRALEFMQRWKAEHFDREEWGTPEDWAKARELNEEFEALAEREFPGIEELLDRYYDLSLTERRAFREEHPEIGAYYDLRDWFGEQEGNEIWAWFYGGGGVGSREYGVGGRAGTRGARRYYRRYYGGGGRRRYTGERFGGTRYPPKVYLETPSPWEGALREEFRPRRGATPWLIQASRRVEPLPWLKTKW